jgi:hypothetical protein
VHDREDAGGLRRRAPARAERHPQVLLPATVAADLTAAPVARSAHLPLPRPAHPDKFASAAFYVGLLADRGPLLGKPYTRQLDGKRWELRFHLDGRPFRLTSWIASGRRIVLLTVFAKTRMRESVEVDRARRAMARCRAMEHTVEDGDG